MNIPKKLHIGKRHAYICKSEHSFHVSREKEHVKKRLAVISWLIAALGIFMSNVLYQCNADAQKSRERGRMQQLDKSVEADLQRMLSPFISPHAIREKHR